jgi:hypothetical protein
MRGALKYGVPIAAGLGVGGYALSQGEDPGSAALAAGAGALGAGGGLLAARQLAGKYSPSLLKAAKQGKVAGEEELIKSAIKMPAGSRQESILLGLADKSIGLPIPSEAAFTRGAGKVAAAGLVPAAALTAGLGGVALGAIPGSMGLPGFGQGGAIDPESPGSSNTASAKYGVTPYASTQYM